MKKITLIIILFLLSYSFFAQDELVWKSILNEEFNNNTKGWYTVNSDLRNAQISNGQLIDGCFENGFAQANVLSVDFNTKKDYMISFSISNLNGDSNKKYRVYEKKNDQSLKETWEDDPSWGFVWGFKDWDNYNCILFNNNRDYNSYVSGNYIYSTAVKIYYKTAGITTVPLDWKKFDYIGTTPVKIKIEQYGENSVRVLAEESEIYNFSGGVFKWYGNKIGPYIGSGAKIALDFVTLNEKIPHPKTSWTENSLKLHWENNGTDQIEGIYESAIKSEKNPKYQLGLIKSDNGYDLIYLSGAVDNDWQIGDIKAYLSKTATPNLYKVKYFMGDKTLNEDLYIGFENGTMKMIWTDREENLYIKLYPTSEDNVLVGNGVKSSGTGFALNSNGYIVTNYHVTEGASSIKVRGINGDFSKLYSANVIIEDKNNDIAIIKIEDTNFTTFGTIPYKINSSLTDVGSSVYALGYPLRATMGDEVKLTNGIISSKTGFQGDITTYQVTVPIQPGNSGGPLFDSNGNVVGIVNAKHTGAENASYAIKTSYLMNLIQVMNTSPKLPSTNTISTKTLSEQVKLLKQFVFIIEIN